MGPNPGGIQELQMTDRRAGGSRNGRASIVAWVALFAAAAVLAGGAASAQTVTTTTPTTPTPATTGADEEAGETGETEDEEIGEAATTTVVTTTTTPTTPPTTTTTTTTTTAEEAGETGETEAEEIGETAEGGPTEPAGPSAELELLGAGTPDVAAEETSTTLVADEADEGEDEEEEGEGEDGEEGETGRLHVAIPGYYQLSVFGLGDMALGPNDPARPYGPNLGQNFYGWSRLRATPELSVSTVKIKAQFDIMTGIIFGDSTRGVDAAMEPRMRESAASDTGAGGELVGIRPFDFRQLFVEWDTGYGILRAGQMTSNWGLGILANDGDRPQTWGFNRYGDLVERIVFATKPFSTLGDGFYKDIIAILGADLVYRDHLADLWDGDLAAQGIFALLWKRELQSIGAYAAYRNQTFADGDHLEVVAVDVLADWTFDLGDSWTLQLAGEGVGVFGSTDVARSLTAAEHDIRQLGGAVRVVGKYLEQYVMQLEAGAATNDANTYDDQLLRFTFDPDYNVGLIMFEEVTAWQSARAATLAGDPALVGEPVPGLELLPTNGGVSGALYLNPTFRARPWEWVEGAVGVLWGYSTADVVSPFEQKVRGVPVNYYGGDSSKRNLGVEIDLAVNFYIPLRLVELQAGWQFGYMFLGDAFDDAAGNRPDDIWLTEGRLTMKF
jgi:hypothetical protein